MKTQITFLRSSLQKRARSAAAVLTLAGALGALLSGAGACSNDDNDGPSNPIVTGGTAGTAGTGGTAGTAGTGGTGDSGSDSGDGGGLIPECKPVDAGQPGCVPCPGSSPEFLNRCTKATCSKFDNSSVPLSADGGLEPL